MNCLEFVEMNRAPVTNIASGYLLAHIDGSVNDPSELSRQLLMSSLGPEASAAQVDLMIVGRLAGHLATLEFDSDYASPVLRVLSHGKLLLSRTSGIFDHFEAAVHKSGIPRRVSEDVARIISL